MREGDILSRVAAMQNRLVEVAEMPNYYSKLIEDEITEQRLFHLITLKDDIERLVKEIDPNRFAPVQAYSLQHQKMSVERLNLCSICGHTRCQSDHK